MSYTDKITMSIDDWREFENDEDISLAYGKVTFLSTRPNSHKYKFSEEVLRRDAKTFLGKFLITDYDKYTMDSTTHTTNQKIVGYFPTNQEILFDRDKDGYLQASADVTISKIYAREVYKMFKEKNFRSVSVEELVGFTDETKDLPNGEVEKEVSGFEGIGVTILGLKYNPSVPTANIKLIKMSEDNIPMIEKEYKEYYNLNNKEFKPMDKILKKLDIIEDKLENINNHEENKMEKEDENVMAKSEVKDKAKMAEPKEKENKIKNEPKKENPGNTNKENNNEEKMSELEIKLAEKEDLIRKQASEIEELRQYKTNIELSQKESIISETLNKVSEYVDETRMTELKEGAEKCSFSEIDGWKNEVLASITDKVLMSKNNDKNKEVMDMGLPQENKETKMESIYDYVK